VGVHSDWQPTIPKTWGPPARELAVINTSMALTALPSTIARRSAQRSASSHSSLSACRTRLSASARCSHLALFDLTCGGNGCCCLHREVGADHTRLEPCPTFPDLIRKASPESQCRLVWYPWGLLLPRPHMNLARDGPECGYVWRRMVGPGIWRGSAERGLAPLSLHLYGQNGLKLC
jgi:hypothetical protein